MTLFQANEINTKHKHKKQTSQRFLQRKDITDCEGIIVKHVWNRIQEDSKYVWSWWKDKRRVCWPIRVVCLSQLLGLSKSEEGPWRSRMVSFKFQTCIQYHIWGGLQNLRHLRKVETGYLISHRQVDMSFSLLQPQKSSKPQSSPFLRYMTPSIKSPQSCSSTLYHSLAYCEQIHPKALIVFWACGSGLIAKLVLGRPYSRGLSISFFSWLEGCRENESEWR